MISYSYSIFSYCFSFKTSSDDLLVYDFHGNTATTASINQTLNETMNQTMNFAVKYSVVCSSLIIAFHF